MASENGILDLTFQASGNDLSASTDNFIFVKMGETSPQVVQAHAGDPILGISQDVAKKSNGIPVRLIGVSKLRMGGTVKAGNTIKSDASGNGVLGLGNAYYGAQALEDGVSSDIITVLLEQTQAAT